MPEATPVTLDTDWRHAPLINARLAGSYCVRTPAQGTCPYTNICEHCPNVRSDSTFLPILARPPMPWPPRRTSVASVLWWSSTRPTFWLRPVRGAQALTNAEMDSHSAFACLFVGQPTLRRRIKLGTFAALDQRIALRFAMPPLAPAETTAYIAHHLNLAGRADTLFSNDAAALIHQV